MASKYVLLNEARREFDYILEYLVMRTGGTSAASALLDEFAGKIALVCENPELFGLSRMPELAALGYRSFPVKSYVVLYFYRDGQVFVAHIFHQRQDYARLV